MFRWRLTVPARSADFCFSLVQSAHFHFGRKKQTINKCDAMVPQMPRKLSTAKCNFDQLIELLMSSHLFLERFITFWRRSCLRIKYMNLSNFRSTEINKKQKLDKIITTSMIQHELFWQSHWRFLFGFAYDLHLTVELRAWFYRPFDSYENKQLMSLVLTHSIVRYIVGISPLLYDINTCFVGFRSW